MAVGTVGGRGFNGFMTTSPLVATTDLSEEQILERATVCARGMQRAGAELLVLAYEWAVAHPADRLDPKEAGKPGRERATILGGPGTPEVTEFAAAEFGAASSAESVTPRPRHVSCP